jgi:hypothetical protein
LRTVSATGSSLTCSTRLPDWVVQDVTRRTKLPVLTRALPTAVLPAEHHQATALSAVDGTAAGSSRSSPWAGRRYRSATPCGQRAVDDLGMRGGIQ